MKELDDLTGFFYALVPGALFLFALKQLDLLARIGIHLQGGNDFIFFTLLGGFSLGLLFDNIATSIRYECLDKNVLDKLLSRGDLLQKVYAECLKKLAKLTLVDSDDLAKDNTSVIHFMDNYIRYNANSINIYYSVRKASFWANVFVADAFLILSMLLFKIFDTHTIFFFILIALLFVSKSFFIRDRERFYSTIIKTFSVSKEFAKSK